MPVSNLSTGNSYGSCKPPDAAAAQFPVGLRVLVVDDDMTCLKILEQMLRKCMYHVTTCTQAEDALSLLRDRKGCFDLVISDVHMPDMDGFKLLELVGLEMDLPVIMMSADGSTGAVMKGVKHGACDYLIKPVRLEELKNIWQHVVRKKFNGNKEHEQSGSLEDSDRNRRGVEDAEYTSSVNEGADSTWKAQKKKREAKDDDDDGELENDDPSSTKKQRVVWSVELHQQFVGAVNQLGIDKAVPKRILELMNIPGLTRENVASHLQKFRLYLKRLSGGQHQGGMPNAFCGPMETNAKVAPLGRLDFQALAASGQIPAETLAAFHAELMGRHSGSIALPALDQTVVPQASIQGPKCLPVEHRVAFGQPLVKCQSNISKQFPQPSMAIEDMSSSGFGTWPSNHVSAGCPSNNLGGLNDLQNGNMMVQMLQQQQPQPILTEPNNGINVQPSCLVVPSPSPNSFHVGNNNVPITQNSLGVPSPSSYSFQAVNSPFNINQNSSYSNCCTVGDYIPFSSQSNNVSLGTGQLSDGEYKSVGVLNGYSIQGPISSSGSSCSLRNEGGKSWRVQHSAMNLSSAGGSPVIPNLCDVQGSGTSIGVKHDHQGQGRSHGFVGKGTSIPSRFAVDDIEYPTDDLYQRKTYIGDDSGRVKQEIHLDFADGSKVGKPVLPPFSGDFMGVLSKDSRTGGGFHGYLMEIDGYDRPRRP